MAVRLPDKAPIDPHGGVEDLKRKLLRTPADPKDSFSDDPLRMLRAFRFASQLDFKIDRTALDAIEVLREELQNISAERIRDELSKLLLGDAPARALELADQVGLTDIFLPELGELKLQQDPVQRHKDVFHHTLAVVERTDPNLILRLAALLHDIGKPHTRKIDEAGVSFHQHDVVGARMARRRLQELRYPNDVVDAVSEIIRLHHRFHGYEGQWTDSAVRRYVRDAGSNLRLLNPMVRADCTTRNPAKAKLLAKRVDDLEERIAELAAQEELGKFRPELDGRRVMELLDLEPGPDVGRAMDFLMEIRLDEGKIGEEEVTRRLLEWAEENGVGRFGLDMTGKEHPGTPYFADVADKLGERLPPLQLHEGDGSRGRVPPRPLGSPRRGSRPGRRLRPRAPFGRARESRVWRSPVSTFRGRSSTSPRRALREAGVSASFFEVDARQMPFDDEFDAVISICQGGFGLMGKDDALVLRRMTEAVRSGGASS